MCEEAVVAKLNATAGVTALVGSRIYPLFTPPDVTLPAVVYERISTTRPYSHQGAEGQAVARLQIDSIATTLAGAKAVSEQIRAALSGFSGTVGTTKIAACFLRNELNLDDKELIGNVRVVQDFVITYGEV